MKRKLLPIGLLSVLGLLTGVFAGCGPSTSYVPPEPPPVTSIEIANKDALTEDFHAETSRLLDIRTTPEINVTLAINSGDIVVTTSDPSIASISGKIVYALAEGTATVTVTYKETLHDEVELTILPRLGEPPMKTGTIKDIQEFIKTDGDEKVLYYHKAIVSGFNMDQIAYGDIFAKDAWDDPDQATVYGLTASPDAMVYDPSVPGYAYHNPQDYLTNDFTKDIALRDELDLVSSALLYKGTTFELKSILRGVNGVITPNYTMSTDEVLAHPFQKRWSYQVTGEITSFDNDDGGNYGNLHIKTEGSAKELYIFGLTAQNDKLVVDEETGDLKFNNPQDFLTNPVTAALKVGDTITVCGVRSDYSGTVEIQGYLMAKMLVVDHDKADVELGTTYQIVATLKNGTDAITYSSANPEIATVDETGLVTGVAVGKTDITVACGDLTKTVAINVYVPVEEPAYQEATLADILAPEEIIHATQAYTTTVKVKDFTNNQWTTVEKDTDKYGNMLVTDEDGENEAKVYGATATKTALSWNVVTGQYNKFNNPKDFLTNAGTKDINIGDLLGVIVIRADFKPSGAETATKQISIIVTAVNGVEIGGGGGEQPSEGLTATFDCTKIPATGVTQKDENEYDFVSLSFGPDGVVTMSTEMGSSANYPNRFWVSTTGNNPGKTNLRLYTGNTLSFTVNSNYLLISVTFLGDAAFPSADYTPGNATGTMSGDNKTYTMVAVDGTQPVTFTHSSGTVKIATIKVNYKAA